MRKYTNEELKSLLEKVITKNHTHKWYNRTVELAEFYKKLVTGKNQNDLVISYKPRESDEQQKQRCNITNTRTQYVSNKVLSVFKRVPRSDSVVDNIYYDNEAEDNNDRITEIQARFENFYNGETMKDWLTEAFEHWEFIDPNAWLVVEFRNVENDKPYIYPVEVPSHQAVDYEWHHGELQYLIVKQGCDIWEKDKSKTKSEGVPPDLVATIRQIQQGVVRKGDRFILYAADYAIEYIELASPDAIMPEENTLYKSHAILTLQVGTTKKRFAVKEYETKSKICPAKQFGYIKDPETDRMTYVSPLHSAEFIYKDLINTKSEYDLAKALHGFLQKIQYAKACDYEADFEQNNDRCLNGTLSVSGKKCPSCGGAGLKLHKTTQDIILVQWPDGKEEHIPLDQAIHYVQIPDYIIAMWKKEVADLERDVSFAIFNTNLFDRSEIAVTATEKRINLEAANDVLYDYGCQVSAFVKFITRMAAIHTMNDDKIVIDHKITQFNLETTLDLLGQRSLAVEAGAPYTIIQQIDMQILSKQSQDDPVNVEWIRVREKFRPFREKSKEEKMFILADMSPDDPKKVLYIHFEEIMDMIEFMHPQFIDIKLNGQKKLVDAYVAEFIIKKKSSESFRESIDPNDPKATLRGSVGGVTGLVAVAQAVANGEMTESAAETILKEIYGLDPAVAAKIIEIPPTQKRATEAKASKGEAVTDTENATV